MYPVAPSWGAQRAALPRFPSRRIPGIAEPPEPLAHEQARSEIETASALLETYHERPGDGRNVRGMLYTRSRREEGSPLVPRTNGQCQLLRREGYGDGYGDCGVCIPKGDKVRCITEVYFALHSTIGPIWHQKDHPHFLMSQSRINSSLFENGGLAHNQFPFSQRVP